jgi:hypothetical protein
MMHKEKADQLVKQFYPEVQWKLGQEDCLDRAKRCALIVVNEILNANGLHPNDTDYDYNKAELYWQEVKQEIENYDTKRKSRAVS